MSNILSIFTPSPPSSTPSTPTPPTADCLACRITGTLTFALVGAYFLTKGRQITPSPFGKRLCTVAGLGFITIGAVRWTSSDTELAAIGIEEVGANDEGKVTPPVGIETK